MVSLGEIRAKARESLKGHWGQAALATLVYMVVVIILTLASQLPMLQWLSMGSMVFGALFAVALYRTHRGTDDYDNLFGLMFDFSERRWVKYLLYQLAWMVPSVLIVCVVAVVLIAVGAMVGALNFSALPTDPNAMMAYIAQSMPMMFFTVFILCMAAYLYLAFGMALVPYIIFDHPELGCKEVLRRSWYMMNGKKMKYFLLQLSFIGWILLGVFTLGIGFLFVQPYILTATAEFYLQVKAEHGERGDQVVYEDDEVETVEAEEIR